MESWLIAGAAGLAVLGLVVYGRLRRRKNPHKGEENQGLVGWYPRGSNPYDSNTPEPPHFMTKRFPPAWRQETDDD